MTLRLITLSEDTVSGPELLGQLGLSILVESNEARVLFDTGQGISAAFNAQSLGVDIRRVDRIVLSHGHFDHVGGLRNILAKIRKKEIEIIGHPDIWKNRFARGRYIGIPFQREELKRLGAQFRLTEKPTEISENILTSGEIPMTSTFERLSPKLLVKEGSATNQDEVLDDQALIITSHHGLIVLLGCAHRGVINTINHAMKLTGADQLYMVVGGCHLKDPDSGLQTEATIAALKELDVKKVGVSHCTGLPASIRMREAFGDRFFFNHAGSVIIVD